MLFYDSVDESPGRFYSSVLIPGEALGQAHQGRAVQVVLDPNETQSCFAAVISTLEDAESNVTIMVRPGLAKRSACRCQAAQVVEVTDTGANADENFLGQGQE